MKKILVTILSFVIIGCATKRESKKIDEMAQKYDPILERDAQVNRLITMIKKDKKLDEKRKGQLVDLILETNEKSIKIRKEQSRLRALLVDQLLKSADGTNSKALATSKKLEALNKKNIKGLNSFILKFRSITGERDLMEMNYMRGLGEVHLL